MVTISLYVLGILAGLYRHIPIDLMTDLSRYLIAKQDGYLSSNMNVNM